MANKFFLLIELLIFFFVVAEAYFIGSSHLPRYISDASNFPEEEEYDYIVVGGGTAGCPLAATLSETHRVLLLERGGAPLEFPSVMNREGFLVNLMDTDAADGPAQPFVSDDGIANTRGRILGGGSAINAGFYSRAHPGFFNSSVDGGGGTVTSWNMSLVNASYEWVERAVTFRPQVRSWQSAVRDGLLEANVTPYNGFTVHHVVGTKIGAVTFDASGRRYSAADLLALGNPDNLFAAIRGTVDRILIDPAPPGKQELVAIGVLYRDRYRRRHHAMVRLGGEVVLAAGTIGSPQLLMLSGIGDSTELASLGINVALNLPDVGRHMFDNPRNGINIIPSVALDDSLIQIVGIPNSDDGGEAFIEAASGIYPFRVPAGRGPSAPRYVPVATLFEKIPGPLSEGGLTLVSLDVRVAPVVRFNYFARSEDLTRCVAGVRRLAGVLEAQSLEDFRTKFGWYGRFLGRGRQFRFVGPALPENLTDDTAVAEFCRQTVSTVWHYHGGCVSGKVVDGEFRVIGVSNLRVVDGSALKVTPGTNPQATLMMIGRYVGQKMVADKRT